MYNNIFMQLADASNYSNYSRKSKITEQEKMQ